MADHDTEPQAPADEPTPDAPQDEPTPDAPKQEKLEQAVTVESVGPARKKVVIEIPAERVAAKLAANFDELQDDAMVPGVGHAAVQLAAIWPQPSSPTRWSDCPVPSAAVGQGAVSL